MLLINDFDYCILYTLGSKIENAHSAKKPTTTRSGFWDSATKFVYCSFFKNAHNAFCHNWYLATKESLCYDSLKMHIVWLSKDQYMFWQKTTTWILFCSSFEYVKTCCSQFFSWAFSVFQPTNIYILDRL